MNDEVRDAVANYYSDKFRKHGATPAGVDWNSAEGQVLRLNQLLKIRNGEASYSINDLGCGYGGLIDVLLADDSTFSYGGYDVSADMIDEARRRYMAVECAVFAVSAVPDIQRDYTVASGIFNVKLGMHDSAWQKYVESVIETLDRSSLKGFAFNILTGYSDSDKQRPDLYYASPEYFFRLCKEKYARNVALLHDYGLYEFTILVRKAV